jgi:hypothetical protein
MRTLLRHYRVELLGPLFRIEPRGDDSKLRLARAWKALHPATLGYWIDGKLIVTSRDFAALKPTIENGETR